MWRPGTSFWSPTWMQGSGAWAILHSFPQAIGWELPSKGNSGDLRGSMWDASNAEGSLPPCQITPWDRLIVETHIIHLCSKYCINMLLILFSLIHFLCVNLLVVDYQHLSCYPDIIVFSPTFCFRDFLYSVEDCTPPVPTTGWACFLKRGILEVAAGILPYVLTQSSF